MIVPVPADQPQTGWAAWLRTIAATVNNLSAQANNRAGLPDAVDDTAAAALGVPVGGTYRSGSHLMVRIASHLAAALLLTTVAARAQQVPNPAPLDAIVGWVGSNAALKTHPTKTHPVYRAGFAAAGDGGAATYTHSNTACALSGGNGDDGSQVKDDATGCWLLQPQPQIDLRVWGAKANDPAADSGPATRAAALYSESTGATVSVPAGTFFLNTLDSEGSGALVFGKLDRPTPAVGYPLPTFKAMPNFVGQAWHTDPNMCFVTEPAFSLGPGLNRPLLFIKSNSESARLENLCLSGNRASQTGFPGGPGGKLFTVVAEAAAAVQPSSSLTAKNIAIRDGYNGNLFHGAARGVLYLTDIWSLYSGQTATDYGLYLDSYDGIIYNLQQGLSTGYGVYIANGINYTFTAGGSFYNDTGMYVSGAVVDLQIAGMRFQANNKQGLVIGNEPAVAGQQIGGRAYLATAFNNNSAAGNNLYDDIAMLGDSVFRDSFVAPAFDGPQNPADPKPRYNIGTQANVRVNVAGAMTAAASNVSGFTNDYAAVVGDYQVTPAWVPHLWGTTSLGTGVETPAAGFPTGQWSRFGKQASVQGSIKLTALTAVGAMVVGTLPHVSAVGSYTACSVARIVGWTPPAGYTAMSMMLPGNSSYATLWRDGPGVASAPVQPAEFGAAPELTFACTYPIKDGT